LWEALAAALHDCFLGNDFGVLHLLFTDVNAFIHTFSGVMVHIWIHFGAEKVFLSGV